MDKLHPEATEASQFVQTLHDFHRGRGTDFKFAPKICGQEIDLHQLYKTVTAAGGSGKLNERPERWYEITNALRFPDKCPNSTLVLRQIYQRYLGTYEKVTFLGEDPDLEVEDSGEVTSSSFRGGRNSSRGGGVSANAFVIQVPMSYNRQQHEVTDGQRANYGLSTQLAPPVSPFERLCFSLQSGLPNEETFALNVCTLLANGGRHAMQLNKAPPRLVDLLVSQAGLTADDGTLRDTLDESWRACEARRMTRFWQEHVDPAVGLCLGLPPLDRFAEAAEKIVEERDCVELIAEGGFMATREALEDEDDFFNLDNEVSPRDAEAQRVLRIALILHNLSFEEANAQILAQNQAFLRMMMLAAVSRWASLRQVGLDCLSNVAPHLQLNVHDDIVCRSLLRLTIDGILKSEDRGLVTRCLDIITHLAQCESNQQTLVAELDSSLLERLLELLTVHDVLLIIHSLETLYALTELGDGVCERLVAVRHAIAMLVSMLSLDPIAYGPGAQRGMKIVEHFDPLLPPATAPLIPSTLSSHHGHTQLMPAVVQTTHMAPPAAPVQPLMGRPMGQPNGGIASGAQPPIGATPPVHTVAPSMPGGAPDTGSVGETEALATAWIRAHIELTPGSSVGRQELYADYVNFCSKAGRRSVLSGHHFSTCIRTIFPQSALKVTQVTGPNQQLSQVFQYENLRRRAVPLTVTVTQTGVGSAQAGASTAVVNQVSRNLQKAALDSARAALPEGAQAPPTVAVQRPPSTKTALTPGEVASITTAPVLTAAVKPEDGAGSVAGVGPHVNGVAEKDSAATTGEPLASRGVGPASEATSVTTRPTVGVMVTAPATPKANGNHETAISNTTSNAKVYKSSPLLNGLLDRGTSLQQSPLQRCTTSTAVNGNGAVDVVMTGTNSNSNNGTSVPLVDSRLSLPNGEMPLAMGTTTSNTMEVRKRRLTFVSEDSNSQDATQERQQSSLSTNANSALSKLLQNGTIEDSNSGNPNSTTTSTAMEVTTASTGGSILNNNNNAKRMKLMQDDEKQPFQPPVKHTNGDVKARETGVVALGGNPIDSSSTPVASAVTVATSNPSVVGSVLVAPKDTIPFSSHLEVSSPHQGHQQQASQQEVIEGAKQPHENINKQPQQQQQQTLPTCIVDPAQQAQVQPPQSAQPLLPQAQSTIQQPKEVQRSVPPSHGAGSAVVVTAPALSASVPVPAAPAIEKRVLRYYCEWKGCDQSFGSARHVLLHAIYAHVGLRGGSNPVQPPPNMDPARDSLFCQWGVGGDKESCDGMARRRLSLCTHVQERHCSEAHLHVQAIRRQQISQFGAASLPAPVQPPPHPGYAADAAAHAIRRHAASFHAYRDAADEREHPVTRSVRLTAALILRNLARHVPSCRSRLAQYESRLSQVAMSALESSRTVAQCLADLHMQQDSAAKTTLSMEHSQLFQEGTRPRYSTD
ncbi:AT-rich interactive domain-containing protein 2-like isoform X3 [Varroa destructor]|uniref:AT-rich interactive domain-containing protein 2 n=1 Tax=Varroa destructor TaxID=109461 RepID=A0A7M7J6T3_VARDE|nr:AT-rich interactive domain-containing protein 2-like isoform X3 [Varroa destructor]